MIFKYRVDIIQNKINIVNENKDKFIENEENENSE